MVALTRTKRGVAIKPPERYEPDPTTVFEDDDGVTSGDESSEDLSFDDKDARSTDGDDCLSDDFIDDSDDDQDISLRDAIDTCLVYWVDGDNASPENIQRWLELVSQRMVTAVPSREVLEVALQQHIASTGVKK
jgi:hypothetical protein